MEKLNDRRQFLKVSTGAAGAALLAPHLGKAMAAACAETPPQTSGPFYPGESVFQADHDLTQMPGHRLRAEGQIIYVRGRVVDQDCRPVANANVELWQACASGKYNNPKDPNPAPLDPNFKYWAENFTDANGEYWFKTIVPGAYPASDSWTRPPHLHFKISCLGYHELVTQMYFKGNHLNAGDRILQQLPERDRTSVLVEFRPVGEDLEPGALLGQFDISIRKV